MSSFKSIIFPIPASILFFALSTNLPALKIKGDEGGEETEECLDQSVKKFVRKSFFEILYNTNF